MEYGLNEWCNFPATVTGAGVVRIWEMRRSYDAFHSSGQGSSDSIEKLYEQDVKAQGEAKARELAFARNDGLRVAELFGDGRIPLWRAVSGIHAETDVMRMHPGERFGRFARLIRAVERVVRYEWRAFRRLKAVGGRQESGGDGSSDGDPLTPLARTAAQVAPVSGEAGGPGGERDMDPRVSWWDPSRWVCGEFGMAYSALSRVCREFAGLSASDLTDRVKAEGLRAAMRGDVKRWLLEIYAEHPELKKLEDGEALELLWDYLQQKRGRGKGSRASWACGHGFSSYTRFHRASLAAHGVSPIELERMVMEEVFEEGALKADVKSETANVGEEVEGGGEKNAEREVLDGRQKGEGGRQTE